MSLTTPVLKNFNSNHIHDHWFLYWKTSAKLWAEKIREQNYVGSIYIPIFWGFHSETGDDYDFGRVKPESNLVRLAQTCSELNLKPIFLVPVNAQAFLVNGGVPTLLARSLSYDQDQYIQAFINPDGVIHKLYSFFDTRVFEAYSEFTYNLAKHLDVLSDDLSIYAMESGCVEQGQFKSFRDASSKTFLRAFARYQAKQTQSSQQSFEPNSQESNPKTYQKTYQKTYKEEFSSQIKDLYLKSLNDSFKGKVTGLLSYNLLGSSKNDFFHRLSGPISNQVLCQKALEGHQHQTISSPCLLGSEQENSILRVLISDLQSVKKDQLSSSEQTNFFEDLKLFRFVEDKAAWEKSGLTTILEKYYSGTFFIEQNYQVNEDLQEQKFYQDILFFNQENTFSLALKTFMQGEKVILDINCLDSSKKRRLESFILENDLKQQKMKRVVELRTLSLGEGVLYLLDTNDLNLLNSSKKEEFWLSLFNTLDFKHMNIKSEDDLLFLWLTKPGSSNDLSYDEYRRLKIYNPSSYNKKCILEMPNNFALLKYLDQLKVSIESSEKTITLSFQPEACITLEFGVYE